MTNSNEVHYLFRKYYFFILKYDFSKRNTRLPRKDELLLRKTPGLSRGIHDDGPCYGSGAGGPWVQYIRSELEGARGVLDCLRFVFLSLTLFCTHAFSLTLFCTHTFCCIYLSLYVRVSVGSLYVSCWYWSLVLGPMSSWAFTGETSKIQHLFPHRFVFASFSTLVAFSIVRPTSAPWLVLQFWIKTEPINIRWIDPNRDLFTTFFRTLLPSTRRIPTSTYKYTTKHIFVVFVFEKLNRTSAHLYLLLGLDLLFVRRVFVHSDVNILSFLLIILGLLLETVALDFCTFEGSCHHF